MPHCGDFNVQHITNDCEYLLGSIGYKAHPSHRLCFGVQTGIARTQFAI